MWTSQHSESWGSATIVTWFEALSRLLCDRTPAGNMQCTYLLIPGRETMTEQSMDTNKEQLGEPRDLLGFLTGA